MLVSSGHQIGFRPHDFGLDLETGVAEDTGVDILFASGLAVGEVEIDACGGRCRLICERARRHRHDGGH